MDPWHLAHLVAYFAEPHAASTPAPDTRVSRADAIADVRQFAELLEASHPDPFSRSGGRVAFQRQLHEILDGLPTDGLTSHELLRRIRPLVARVRDGHTQIGAPWQRRTMRRTRVELEVVDERLVVGGVFREEERALLGERVEAVEGVAWRQIVDKTAGFRGADNAYDNLRHLAQAIERPDVLEDLLGSDSPLASVHVELEARDGAPHSR